MTPAAPTAHDYITISGARHNNLRNITLQIPKRQLTVFTGVSGSGKSSLVFGTIAAESQRMINETYPAFLQGFMPTLDRPDVDHLEGLTASIVVDQERLGANPRSTVGTVTDAAAILRTIFAAIATPNLGSTDAYSFNVPSVEGQGAIKVAGKEKREVKKFSITGGMCPACEGRGRTTDLNLAAIVDDSKSLHEGAILVPGYTADGWAVRLYAESGLFPADAPIATFTDQQRQDFFHHPGQKIKIGGVNMTYEGLLVRLQKSVFSKDPSGLQPHMKVFVDRAVTFVPCPECGGTRLAKHTLDSVIVVPGGVLGADRWNIAEVFDLELKHLPTWVDAVSSTDDGQRVAPALRALRELAQSFVDLGIGYLTLSRASGTLSGGESQRVKLLKHLGSALTDMTYVFDEPSTGMHPHDISRMNQILTQLRDKGNTVLVVEHKPQVMEIADWVVDLGPNAGSGGGQIMYQGPFGGLSDAEGSRTGEALRAPRQLNESPRTPTGVIQVRGASTHNLEDVDVDIPTGVLCVVTGVAGSGKSTLVHGFVPDAAGGEEHVAIIDQQPIRTNRRSNPATYTGMGDAIRKAFAKATGAKSGMFSANSEGGCEGCKGSGVIETQLSFMETVSVRCHQCEGTGFGPEAWELKAGGKSIVDVMRFSARQAAEFFTGGGEEGLKVPAAKKVCDAMVQVGLGYLKLGQPLTTLSGGERQRLKIVSHLVTKGGADTIILDEPTSGLHLSDIDTLLALFDTMVAAGKSLIVIEHHPAVIAAADWVIDMGPGGGSDGGQVVFEGTVSDLVKSDTLTGKHLKDYVEQA